MRYNLRIQLLSITRYLVHDYVFMGRVLSTKFKKISPIAMVATVAMALQMQKFPHITVLIISYCTYIAISLCLVTFKPLCS